MHFAIFFAIEKKYGTTKFVLYAHQRVPVGHLPMKNIFSKKEIEIIIIFILGLDNFSLHNNNNLYSLNISEI